MKTEGKVDEKRTGKNITLPTKATRCYEDQLGKKSSGPFQGTPVVKK